MKVLQLRARDAKRWQMRANRGYIERSYGVMVVFISRYSNGCHIETESLLILISPDQSGFIQLSPI